jgi:hypothetical protein
MCGVTSKGSFECFGDLFGKGKVTMIKKPSDSNAKFIQISVSKNDKNEVNFLNVCGVTDLGKTECFNSATAAGTIHKSKRESEGVKFVQVSVCKDHGCGLTSIGTIECWGKDNNNVANGHKEKLTIEGNAFGFFCENNQNNQVCINKCPENTFKKDDRCQKCGDGTYANKIGSTSKEACKAKDQCNEGESYIPDKHSCQKCPRNTFSENGADCIPCPDNTPTTKGNTGQGTCQACGDGHSSEVSNTTLREKGYCNIPILNEEACKNSINRLDKTIFLKTRDLFLHDTGVHGPPGCYYDPSKQQIVFHNNISSETECSNENRCICANATNKCEQCPKFHYSNSDTGGKCKYCATKFLDSGRTKCHLSERDQIQHQLKTLKKGGLSPDEIKKMEEQEKKMEEQEKKIKDMLTQIEETKEIQNDISDKTLRLWQNAETRKYYKRKMEAAAKMAGKKQLDDCKAERNKGTLVFPAIEVIDEIDKEKDTTCIDTNRNELLKAFCSFSSDLDSLFEQYGMDKQAKTFWPNICCKERNEEGSLVKCKPPPGIKKEDMIPFALSQGGEFNRHNLYTEVTEAIKKGGYIHNGMKKLLISLKNHIKKIDIDKTQQLIKQFFDGVTLCGPRIINAPRSKDDKKLCELFVPYQHSMKNFYNLIENMLPKNVEPMLFMETMEQSLLVRQLASKKNRLGKDGNQFIMKRMMEGKSQKKTEPTCKVHTGFEGKELERKKEEFCKGSNHLDLSNTNVKNVAIYYLKDELSNEIQQHMVYFKNKIRYNVADESCPSKLFDAKDISIQNVAMDIDGKQNEWVAVVNLNDDDADGYLQKELPECKVKKYLISSTSKVKTYIDHTNCCDGFRDYNTCKNVPGCEAQLEPLTDIKNNNFERVVKLTGSDYSIDPINHINQRRKLLTKTGSQNTS